MKHLMIRDELVDPPDVMSPGMRLRPSRGQCPDVRTLARGHAQSVAGPGPRPQVALEVAALRGERLLPRGGEPPRRATHG